MAEAAATNTWSKDTLCRYFMNGVCMKGESCQFSHDFSQKPSNVCRYYIQGRCSYGDNCRFDHIKTRHSSVDVNKSGVSPNYDKRRTQSADIPSIKSNFVTLKKSGSSLNAKPTSDSIWSSKDLSKVQEFVPGQKWTGSGPCSYSSAAQSGLEERDDSFGGAVAAAAGNQVELCPYAAHGQCRFAERCPYVHGEVCDLCFRPLLVPNDQLQNEQHRKACMDAIEQDAEMAFALADSRDKQCGICMDTVLEKLPPSERKFGILSNCNHVFCLSCIRKWRSEKQYQHKVVKACPECRTQSAFITPSSIWVEDDEKKAKLIEGYKTSLRQIDCKYFKKGDGDCPFNEFCFYRHTYPDGRVASPRPRRRRTARNADNEEVQLEQLVLWNMLEEVEARRRQSDTPIDVLIELTINDLLRVSGGEDLDNFDDLDESDLLELLHELTL